MDNKEQKYEFEVFFDNFITKGYVEKEKEIAPGFKVKIKALSAEEQIKAESILLANNPYVPSDTIGKVRSINILSMAITEINSVPIYEDDATEKENENKRKKIYEKLMKMPESLIDKIYTFYWDVISEQKKIYDFPEEFKEKVENF